MKIQNKKSLPLKFYPKRYEDICRFETWEKRKNHFEAVDGTIDELISGFKDFYKEAHRSLFASFVKEVWLEQQIIYRDERRVKRVGNGKERDVGFGQFMKIAVGTSQRVLTANFCFTPVSTYFIDFFPEFLFHNPFKNPEKYKYPYENITLDHLLFVYQMDNRLEMLDEAEKKGMSYAEFINWATNWALCHNDDIGEDFYTLASGHAKWPYIRNNKLERFWENDKFNFNVKHG